ncbi:MAG: toxin ParE1/3/4 [Motiliproteus sp.]
MRAHFQLSEDGRSDLANIRRYTLRHWGVTQWDIYATQLKQAMQMLSKNPHSGFCCDDIRADFYRLPLKNHSIYFKKGDKKITIIRVLHNSICPDKYLSIKPASNIDPSDNSPD